MSAVNGALINKNREIQKSSRKVGKLPLSGIPQVRLTLEHKNRGATWANFCGSIIRKLY